MPGVDVSSAQSVHLFRGVSFLTAGYLPITASGGNHWRRFWYAIVASGAGPAPTFRHLALLQNLPKTAILESYLEHPDNEHPLSSLFVQFGVVAASVYLTIWLGAGLDLPKFCYLGLFREGRAN
jgi:hypothetical protein